MSKSKRFLAATGIATIGVVGTMVPWVVPVSATPPSGVSVAALAPVVQVGEIAEKAKSGAWKAEIATKEVSDLHVVQVTPCAPYTRQAFNMTWIKHPGALQDDTYTKVENAFLGPF